MMKTIEEILPQRYPFLFVDKIVSVDVNAKKVVCLKNFAINDYFFKGHFPGNPVVPGVIMIEALAQSSIILFSQIKPEIAEKKPNYLFGKVEMKFKRIVTPGDSLILEVTAAKILNNAGIVEAIARVEDQVAAEGTISFGVVLKK